MSVYAIFDEFGVENCSIELVELFPCASKMELERKEGECIKNNDCVSKTDVGRTHSHTESQGAKKGRKKEAEEIAKPSLLYMRNG